MTKNHAGPREGQVGLGRGVAPTVRPARAVPRRAVLPAPLAVAALFAVVAPARAGNATHFDFVLFLNAGDTGIPQNGVPWKNVGIVALDANGQRDDCFADTVTYSDPYSNVSPSSHNFGENRFLFFCPIGGGWDLSVSITPLRPGPHQLTVTDINHPSIKSILTFNVDPGPVSRLELAPLSASAILGDGAAFRLIARDRLGFQVTNYFGRVNVTNTDSAAVTPSAAEFTGGSTTFTVKSGTLGTQWITVTDPDNPALTATASISVVPAPHFEIQIAESLNIEAGIPTQVLYRATNADGSTNTGYRGTVHWTSTDTKADPPTSDYTFTPTDQGWTSPLLDFRTAGDQTVTATDTVNANITGTAAHTILGGDVTRLEFSGVWSTMIAGPLEVIVNVFDAWDNPATNAFVHFDCDDPNASVPAAFNFRIPDHGTRQFRFTLPTARLTTCTATSGYGPYFSTSFSVNVHPGGGGGARFYVSELISPRRAGARGSLRVTVADGYGNRVGSYRSRVHFASTDPRASLPADYTFTAADSGSHVFDGVILRTAGRQSVTATDVHTSAVNGSQTGIAVTAGRFAQFLVSELASLRRAGTAGSIRVTATDANGNRVSSFGGTVHFTSSDSAARLPGDYTFTAADAGSHVFAGAVILGTPGPQWVRVADTTAVERRGDLTVDVEKKPRSR